MKSYKRGRPKVRNDDTRWSDRENIMINKHKEFSNNKDHQHTRHYKNVTNFVYGGNMTDWIEIQGVQVNVAKIIELSWDRLDEFEEGSVLYVRYEGGEETEFKFTGKDNTHTAVKYIARIKRPDLVEKGLIPKSEKKE